MKKVNKSYYYQFYVDSEFYSFSLFFLQSYEFLLIRNIKQSSNSLPIVFPLNSTTFLINQRGLTNKRELNHFLCFLSFPKMISIICK